MEPDTSTTSSEKLRRVPRYIGSTATAGYHRVVDILTRDIFNKPSSGQKANSNWYNNILEKTQNNASKIQSVAKTKITSNSESSHRSPELKNVVRRSNDILATATTVFPFDFFPDTISVDRTKVTIKKRTFFWSEEVISFRIEDVLNVSTAVGPFFGSLTIASRVMSTEDHFTTNFLWRSDAIHLKHIIQGYVIARHNGIDTKHLSASNLIKTLKELGHDANS